MKEMLEKAKKYLSGMNVAHALVLAIVAKSLFSETPVSVVLLTVPVLAYEAYKLFLKSKTPDPVVINDEVKKELELIKSRVVAMSMEKNVKSDKVRYF